LGVLQRIRASRWIRAGLLVVILGFCSYGLALEWPQVHRALDSLHWYTVAGALGAAMASAACMMLAWRRLLADLGSKLPLLVAARVTFMAQLGKYVPGGFWSLAAQVELGHDYDVPRRRGAASVIMWMAGLLAVGLAIGAAGVLFTHAAVSRRYLLFLAAIPVIAVCLAPPILHRLLNFVLKLVRQEPLEEQVSWRGLGGALAWIVGGWILQGVQTWLLVADLAHDGIHSLFVALGAYALACSVAMLLVVVPSGIGVREVILIAALARVLTPGAALAVALVVRAVATASDIAWGGIAVTLGRSARYGRYAKAAELGRRGVQEIRQGGRHRRPSDRRASAAVSAAHPDTAPPSPTADQATSPREPEVAF
jgi:uncharacterized membrane protein YbhN (UPF0104 family)